MTTSHKELLYIMSPSYSGSTLLTFLLAMHPDIATIGELKATSMGDINEYVCSCGSKITTCGFWGNVSAEMSRQGRRFALNDFGTHFSSDAYLCGRFMRAGVKGPLLEGVRKLAVTLLPGCSRVHQSVLQQNQALIETITRLQGGSIFLDDSKDPIRVKYFIESGLWNVKVIYLTRDGRGTTCSYMKHYNAGMHEAVVQWLSKCREMDEVVSQLPAESYIKIRYEDLCNKPEETLKRIVGFANLETSKVVSDFTTVKHHILGNSMRLGSSGEIKLDEKWKTQLSEADLKLFVEQGAAMNARLGYE
ncbi:MAG: sulfotransferase [Gammaproteobacteria bacterium]|nr:sulfotransferase [Gammaproteobacteria bacterium]MDH5652374.1 sulfotransferase [Gammaproteobacteria bacterium]